MHQEAADELGDAEGHGLVTIGTGDHVLLPTPYWPSYPEIVRLWGGEPVDVPVGADQGFVPNGPQIEEAARRHGATGLLINFPNNPSGAVPTREQVEQIVDAALAAGMWILSDEIYARLIYDGNPHVSPAQFERARDHVLVVNGGTKSHSMTGWRIGFLAGPPQIVAAASRIQSQAAGNPCTISQIAAMAMCEEDDDTEFERRLAAFDERRRYLMKEINATEELGLDLPHGAFYALVDVRQACSRLDCDDAQLADRLLTEGLVATVPGSAFAAPGFIRLSYAASMQDLETAVQRIRSFLASTR